MAKLWRYNKAEDRWVQVSEADPLPVIDYVIATSDLTESNLTSNSYTFNPTVDAITVTNTKDTAITVTINTVDYSIGVGETRTISLENALIGIVSFSAGATFVMKGLMSSARYITNKTPEPIIHTLIDNATFNATVEGAWIDLSNFKKGVNIILTQKTGTKTGTITLTTKIQVMDSNDNIIDYQSFPAISTASSPIPEEIYLFSHNKIRFVSSITAGDTGNYALTTVEATIKSL